MFRLALTAGHYMETPGKRCLKTLDPKETREWWLNNRVADNIQKKLKAYDNIDILRTDDTTGKTDVPLKERTVKANKWGADFYLSIHHNAGVNGGKGGGIVSIVYDKTKHSESIEWQRALYDSLISHTGLKGNRAEPLAKMDLHEVRETSMPAVLLELGFMDSATDVPIILTDEFAERCAEAITKVIVDKAGLVRKMSDIEYVQQKCGFADSTIDYLCEYKYAVELFAKLRKAMEE